MKLLFGTVVVLKAASAEQGLPEIEDPNTKCNGKVFAREWDREHMFKLEDVIWAEWPFWYQDELLHGYAYQYGKCNTYMLCNDGSISFAYKSESGKYEQMKDPSIMGDALKKCPVGENKILGDGCKSLYVDECKKKKQKFMDSTSVQSVTQILDYKKQCNGRVFAREADQKRIESFTSRNFQALFNQTNGPLKDGLLQGYAYHYGNCNEYMLCNDGSITFVWKSESDEYEPFDRTKQTTFYHCSENTAKTSDEMCVLDPSECEKRNKEFVNNTKVKPVAPLENENITIYPTSAQAVMDTCDPENPKFDFYGDDNYYRTSLYEYNSQNKRHTVYCVSREHVQPVVLICVNGELEVKEADKECPQPANVDLCDIDRIPNKDRYQQKDRPKDYIGEWVFTCKYAKDQKEVRMTCENWGDWTKQEECPAKEEDEDKLPSPGTNNNNKSGDKNGKNENSAMVLSVLTVLTLL